MFRSCALLMALCFSTGCSLLFSQTPTAAEWNAVRVGTYDPSMKCVPAGGYATVDTVAAVGYGLLGLGSAAQVNDDIFAGFFFAGAIGGLIMAGSFAYSAYRGSQINAECARFDAQVRTILDRQRGPVRASP